MPEIQADDNLAGLMMDAAAAQGTPIEDGDVVVVTQKVVSKVEGKVVDINDVEASQLAVTITAGHRPGPSPHRDDPAGKANESSAWTGA